MPVHFVAEVLRYSGNSWFSFPVVAKEETANNSFTKLLWNWLSSEQDIAETVSWHLTERNCTTDPILYASYLLCY
jgi:hypothetical protein